MFGEKGAIIGHPLGNEILGDVTEHRLTLLRIRFEQIITTCRDLDRQARADTLVQLTVKK